MLDRRLETIRLTASFKLSAPIPSPLFQTYKQIVQELLDYASEKGVTSFYRLKSEKYHGLRRKYRDLPSHYIYTACQMACSIYKSFRKLKRKGKGRLDKPLFKKDVVMLDDHLFSMNLEKWEVSIASRKGRIRAKLLHGTYHEKFIGMGLGQAWLIKRGDEYYLKAVFRKGVKPEAYNGKALAVDINENTVAFGTRGEVVVEKTRERTIRTAYFLKRRKLQSKPRLDEKRLMEKYRGRERRRIDAIYYNLGNKIVKTALEKDCSAIILEDLKNIRKAMRSKEMNGRLNRWSFRRFQFIVEYKAKLSGLNVIYVDAKGTSSLCPECGEWLSPNGYRLLKCSKCGLEEDRDVIAVKNLLRKTINVPSSPVQGESPPMTRGGKT